MSDNINQLKAKELSEQELENIDSFLEEFDMLDDGEIENPEESLVSPSSHQGAGERAFFFQKDDQHGPQNWLEIIREISSPLKALLKSPVINHKDVLQIGARAIISGESLILHLDNNNDFPPPMTVQGGAHIRKMGTGEFITERYGYLHLHENQLSVLSPLWVDDANLTLYWLLLSEQPLQVNRAMLDPWLEEIGIQAELRENLIEEVLNTINSDLSSPGMVAIAQGTPPFHGDDAKVEILVNLDRQVGKELPDGSLDFHHVNFVTNVVTNQMVAMVRPATKGVAGQDIFGRILPAIDGEKKKTILAGQNVRQETSDTVELFYAAANGALRLKEDRLSVVQLLVLESGVNYQTGNIDFVGELCIKGQISQGFTVKASGDITIAESVDNRTEIFSDSDIFVARGITGSHTVVKAGGNIRAQFVHEAKVISGKDIILGDYAYHAMILAGGTLEVRNGGSRRGGTLAGGRSCAYKEMSMSFAGTPLWISTDLLVGLTPDQAERLDRSQVEIEKCNLHIKHLLDYFGLSCIEVAKIKAMVESASGSCRKGLALRAQYLGAKAKNYKVLLVEREDLLTRIGPPPEGAQIKIHEIAFPGVTLAIGNQRKKLSDEMISPLFQLQEDQLVTRRITRL